MHAHDLMHSDCTQLLHQWTGGDQDALGRLLPLVYDELRRIARVRLRGEREGHTLGSTALVHEAYLKLVDIHQVSWQDRAHFLAMASRVMRRILVDHARRRMAGRRGAGVNLVPLDEELVPADDTEKLLEIDESLTRMEAEYPRQTRAIELHYFGGLTLEETGEVLGISAATVMRDLRFAEAWLNREWQEDANHVEHAG
ncbi:MAG TPA: sigma-70 family RNA polymerase sigma factor [Rhodothermales bacterium]|nr:sigma-70 family RNA polymerase sigma factor [Rhodothermales bacterium]